jgi:hypothetical protein
MPVQSKTFPHGLIGSRLCGNYDHHTIACIRNEKRIVMKKKGRKKTTSRSRSTKRKGLQRKNRIDVDIPETQESTFDTVMDEEYGSKPKRAARIPREEQVGVEEEP